MQFDNRQSRPVCFIFASFVGKMKYKGENNNIDDDENGVKPNELRSAYGINTYSGRELINSCLETKTRH